MQRLEKSREAETQELKERLVAANNQVGNQVLYSFFMLVAAASITRTSNVIVDSQECSPCFMKMFQCSCLFYFLFTFFRHLLEHAVQLCIPS